MTLEELLAEARACRRCEGRLPLGPRPVIRARTTARILIVGQAPGTRVHETGVPFNDRSGDRLREWLGVDSAAFYDESRIAIAPMGLCYPGRDRNGGDLPPIKTCAALWHPRLRPLLPALELTLLVGSYAQVYYLGKERKPSLTETVRNWQAYGPQFMPLPHPSWRNTAWLKRNSWFETELLPELRARVTGLMEVSSREEEC